MEPIKINVNIEVGLKQTTLEALKGIFCPQILPSSSKSEGPEPQPEPKTAEEKKTKPAPKTEAPAPAPAPAPVEDDDDLPPADAPAKTPTEDDARQAVKAARSRGVPAKLIKDFMQDKFNIASSVECPAERRQELIDGLNKLAA